MGGSHVQSTMDIGIMDEIKLLMQSGEVILGKCQGELNIVSGCTGQSGDDKIL